MIALIRSEVRKMLTTQVWFWLLLGALAFTVVVVVATILGDGVEGNPSPELATPEGQRNLFANASTAYIFVVILAIIGITAEYRHLTITPTYLATPRRNRVVIAKLITYALTGLVYALATAAVLTAVSVPWLATRDIDVSLTANRIPLVLLAAVLAVTIFGIVGVGIGALIRNQVAAVVITLAYLFVLEPILTIVPWVRDEVAKWLPGQAASAVTQVELEGSTLLEPWQGGLVLTLYGLVFAGLGAMITIRRDVT